MFARHKSLLGSIFFSFAFSAISLICRHF